MKHGSDVKPSARIVHIVPFCGFLLLLFLVAKQHKKSPRKTPVAEKRLF